MTETATAVRAAVTAEAIEALMHQGLGIVAVAAHFGCSATKISQTLIRAGRSWRQIKQAAKARSDGIDFTLHVPGDLADALLDTARKRRKRPADLAAAILEIVLTDNLIDAVLDT